MCLIQALDPHFGTTLAARFGVNINVKILWMKTGFGFSGRSLRLLLSDFFVLRELFQRQVKILLVDVVINIKKPKGSGDKEHLSEEIQWSLTSLYRLRETVSI